MILHFLNSFSESTGSSLWEPRLDFEYCIKVWWIISATRDGLVVSWRIFLKCNGFDRCIVRRSSARKSNWILIARLILIKFRLADSSGWAEIRVFLVKVRRGIALLLHQLLNLENPARRFTLPLCCKRTLSFWKRSLLYHSGCLFYHTSRSSSSNIIAHGNEMRNIQVIIWLCAAVLNA